MSATFMHQLGYSSHDIDKWSRDVLHIPAPTFKSIVLAVFNSGLDLSDTGVLLILRFQA